MDFQNESDVNSINSKLAADDNVLIDGMEYYVVEIPFEPDLVNLGNDVSEFIIEANDEEHLLNDHSNNFNQELPPNVVEQADTLESSESELQENEIITIKPKTRKKLRNFSAWKKNVRRYKYQAGEEHINSSGKLVAKKQLANKKDCDNCKLKCNTKINEQERKIILKCYYDLDQDRKYDFLVKYAQKSEVNRKTRKCQTRRQYSYTYFFEVNEKLVQVCKEFFLGTLAISQTPIYTAQTKKNISGVVNSSNRGSHNKSKISEYDRNYIMDHISSFPTVESHYCRSKTRKQYLDPNLCIAKMYDLYKTKCHEENINPQKESYYRNIFCTKFHLDFHKPRSDRCAVYEIYIVAKKDNKLTEEIQCSIQAHNNVKEQMYAAKKSDKESDIPILCFDLQNVLTIPKTKVGPAYYLSKLNMYNLTAHLSSTKQGFCTIWTEYTGGRSGNDIASALIQILERIFEISPFKQLITWSDSCVPQNKNSYIASAILFFLDTHPYVEEITIKYSVPGHSVIQEVDNLHSQIEKVLRKSEYYSPMPLIRLLKVVNRKKPFCVIQMKPQNFKDFAEFSKSCYNFKDIPFSKLKIIRFTREKFAIQFSNDYDVRNLTTVYIQKSVRKTLAAISPHGVLSEVKRDGKINAKKASDIQQLFPFMSDEDKAYYRVILQLENPERDTHCRSNLTPTTSTTYNIPSPILASPRTTPRSRKSIKFHTPKGRKIRKTVPNTH